MKNVSNIKAARFSREQTKRVAPKNLLQLLLLLPFTTHQNILLLQDKNVHNEAHKLMKKFSSLLKSLPSHDIMSKFQSIFANEEDIKRRNFFHTKKILNKKLLQQPPKENR